MRKKPDLGDNPGKGKMAGEIRVERRFEGERGAGDMLRSLIRAHWTSA